MQMSEDLKKVLMAGLGAMVASGEKIKEIVDASAAKGELTVEQCRVLNQELKRTIEKSLQKNDSDSQTKAGQEESLHLSQILDGVESLTPDELASLEKKLSDLRNKQ